MARVVRHNGTVCDNLALVAEDDAGRAVHVAAERSSYELKT